MIEMKNAHLPAVLAALALSFGAALACAVPVDVSIGEDCDGGFCSEGPTFAPPPPDGGDAEASISAPERTLACIGTTCPAPWVTCPTGNASLCGTNMSNDPQNCGACGVVCAEYTEGLHLGARCVDGACVFECLLSPGVFQDCNGVLDDGCEVDIHSDPRNCGSCGNACAPGVRCIKGTCGCPTGQIDCAGNCIEPRYDDLNCGTCGNACQDPPTACAPMPTNTAYGCADGKCGALKCQGGFGDCNHDLAKGCASDGCETDLTTHDDCGACGNACLPEQECTPDDEGIPRCKDTCAKIGLTECLGECLDILSDPRACGGCGVACQPGGDHQVAVCTKGLCGVECLEGFADCNGDPVDGCEVDLRMNPLHCGACGQRCDVGAGQPCIEGKCLMVECDAGVVAK